jgi:hypothetical protein
VICFIIVNKIREVTSKVKAVFTGSLLSEYREKNRQNNTDDNTCCDGKVEAEALLLYQNVARQFPDKWDLISEQEANPYYDEDYAENNKHLPDCRHHATL